MDPCVSVVVPVCNAQHDLESQVEHILDLLPELTARFEVLIVDDGSTDETMEIALDLAARYPQVEAVRHETQRGVDEAIRTGLRRRQGGVVMVHTPEMPLDSSTLRRFCSQPPLAQSHLGTSASQKLPSPNAVDRLMGWEQVRQEGRRVR